MRDLAACERFYAGVLGLGVLRRYAYDDGRTRSVWLDLGVGAFLALEHTEAPAPPPPAPTAGDPAGLFLLALGIDAGERESWRARLAAAGAPVTHATAFTLYFRDPEGNRLALSHHPTPAATAAEP